MLQNPSSKAIYIFWSFECLSFYNYTSFSISFSTYSTVRTRFSPVSSMYSSVLLVIVSPKTFSLSLTVLCPDFVRTANLGKSALDGRSYKWGMQWQELVFGVNNWRSLESPVRFKIVRTNEKDHNQLLSTLLRIKVVNIRHYLEYLKITQKFLLDWNAFNTQNIFLNCLHK